MADTALTSRSARENFSELVNRAAFAKERVAIHRHGKPIAFVVSVEDAALLESIEDADDLKAFRAAKKEFEESREAAIPWRQVRSKLRAK
jgi:prevent-host-death family protein